MKEHTRDEVFIFFLKKRFCLVTQTPKATIVGIRAAFLSMQHYASAHARKKDPARDHE